MKDALVWFQACFKVPQLIQKSTIFAKGESVSGGKSQNYKLKLKNMTVFICIFYFLSLIFYSPTLAAENFITDYDVVYTVNSNGVTRADMKVTLTNSSNEYYYASSYKIELGFDEVSNIKAYNSTGSLDPSFEKTDKGYTIEITFNNKAVGVGNKQEFTISFDTQDVAKKIGKIWEINIPGIEDEKAFRSFDVELKVPSNFGRPVYVKPSQVDSRLVFNKEILSKSGISLAYGDKQQYSFNLKYHLQNRNLFPIRTEIALPSNTSYQDIYISSINPEPSQVKKDIDGNWLAEYELGAAQKIDVTVAGNAYIFLTPRPEALSESELKRYLKDKPHWQVSDKKIQELAKSYNNPEAIYRYVIDTLEYDFSRVTNNTNRLGALGVLENPESAVCLEFTDLFIAIARAAGIPAREVDGFAYTDNSRERPLSLIVDILHAWPEYYDREKKSWVMIDPTWADTTGGVDYFHILDFDHLAFVKKGESSTYPIPAGGYKLPNEEDKKDIIIAASEVQVNDKNKIELEHSGGNSYISGLPISASMTIINKGPDVLMNEKIIIQSNNLSPKLQSAETGELLPYQKKEITYNFKNTSFLTNQKYDITMQIGEKSYIKSINIEPFYIQYWKLIGGIGFAVFTIFIFITTLKTRRLHFLRRR